MEELIFETPPAWLLVLAMGHSADIPRLQSMYPDAFLLDTTIWRRAFYPMHEEGDKEMRRWMFNQTLSLLGDLYRTYETVVLLGEFPSRAERALYLQHAGRSGIHTAGVYLCGARTAPKDAREQIWQMQYIKEFEMPVKEEGFGSFELFYV